MFLFCSLQDLRNRLSRAEDNLRLSEHAQSAVQLEATARRRDDDSLVAICALLAGCVDEQRARVSALRDQKAMLRRGAGVGDGGSLEREVSTLLDALSGARATRRHATVGRGVWKFRYCAIAVMAATRLRTLHKTSRTLFRLAGGPCRDAEGDARKSKVANMLRCAELGALVRSCMHGVLTEVEETGERQFVQPIK